MAEQEFQSELPDVPENVGEFLVRFDIVKGFIRSQLASIETERSQAQGQAQAQEDAAGQPSRRF